MARRDDSVGWARVWELFHEALERPEPERTAFLDGECGSDEALRREVDELLAAHDRERGALDRSPSSILGTAQAGAELPTMSVSRAPIRELPSGTLLADRFEISRPLGRGGMGAVYAAHDRELGTTVALKTVRPEAAQSLEAQERFRREIHLARQVTHPNVCRIYDLFRHDDLVFLTMEHVPGVTLTERLRLSGPLRSADALPIAVQITAALAAAHDVGVIHRDLKSANVMLVEEGTSWRAVVTDFGLARTAGVDSQGELRLTQTGHIVGTPAYMAPEQLEGGETTPATDIYALGVVLYEMVTGKLPFTGDTPFSMVARRLKGEITPPRDYLPDLDRRWEQAILRCLEREPPDRFHRASDVAAALRGERSAKLWISSRQRSKVIGISLALVAALTIGAGLWKWIGPIGAVPAAAGPVATLEEPAWVLVAAFDNRTGEEVLDGTVEAALRRELSNSELVKVVPVQRVVDTLRLMRRPLDTPIDTSLGREVCVRDGAIRAMVAGTVEKLGTTYQLTAEVIEPVEGATIASVTDEADSEESIPQAIRRLSSRVRAGLGESLTRIQASELRFPNVTTPSLRALQLFTAAMGRVPALVRTDDENRRTEALLAEAIREDSDFALAHLQLAESIWRRGRPAEEYLPHAQRALDLTDSAGEWERQLIRGTYARMTGNLREAVAAFEAAVQLQPDFDVAMLMVIRAFELTEFEKAVPHAVAWSEMQPNFFPAQMEAARALAIWSSDPEAAAPHFDHAQALLPDFLSVTSMSRPRLYEIGWTLFYPAHRSWVENDVEEVLSEVERVRAGLPDYKQELRDWLAGWIVGYYVALGKLQSAEEVLQSSLLSFSPVRRATTEALIAWARGDTGLLRRRLDELPATDPELDAYRIWPILLMARHGFDGKTRQTLAAWRESPRRGRRVPEALFDVVEGELALAGGRPQEAIDRLEPAVRKLLPSGWSTYYVAAESLNRAFRAVGDPGSGRRALEDASEQKLRTERGEGKLFWLNLQWQLAKQLREQGRVSEAERIEAELRRLTALADPDFWLVRELAGAD